MSTDQTLLFNRLEIKYLVDRGRRTALSQDLQAFMSPDSYSGPGGGYTIRSLYFDTPDYRAYHEKIAGTAVRHKLRIRAYGDEVGNTPWVRLEVKSRYLNYIHKIAVDVSREDYGEIEQALARRIMPPAHLLKPESGAKEFFRLQRQQNMQPVVIVQYRRQAFERRELHRVRVNFDDELVATRNLSLLQPLKGARRILRPGSAVLEIKVDNTMPYWLHDLITKYDLQNEAISKYCYAVRSQGRMSLVPRTAGAL
jgi:SPX domain protein involved in polyphosphate accumulation